MERPQPAPERSLMSDVAQFEVQAAISSGELITNQQQFNVMVAALTTDEQLEAVQVVRYLEACSPHLATLSQADIGLLRPARLGEHTEADLSGFEQDYRQLFTGEPESLQILRFASLAQDSGKSLCVKVEGDNRKQTVYNQMVAEAMLDVVEPDVMADDAKEVVRLLVEFDLIGNALQGRFDQAKMDELKARWPARFAHRMADFVTVSYLSDASAHTAYRSFTDMVSGNVYDCVSEQDIAQKQTLDHLFVAPEAGQPLTLDQPYRRVVAALFPDSQRTRALMHDAHVEQSPLQREYIYPTEAEGIWSATMNVPPQRYAVVKEQIEAFAMATGFPISAFLKRGRGDIVSTVTIVRDPSRRFGTPEPHEQDAAAEELSNSFGWQRQPESADAVSDVSACVGLLEGYDKETITHLPAEAVALLLENGTGVDWKTEPTMLLSARRVEDGNGGFKLQSWDEKVMHIKGSASGGDHVGSPNRALDTVKDLASRFNQQRLFLEDGVTRKTIALAA